jgi:large subunit ribosomal protein L21
VLVRGRLTEPPRSGNLFSRRALGAQGTPRPQGRPTVDVEIAAGQQITESEFSVYAIVRCGGRQEKASVDDVLTVDRLTGEVGSTLTLPAVLVVDGDNIVTDPEELGGYQVAAEIIGDANGPKISMIKFKNKTGYRRRLGHRQHYTQVKITGISKGGKPAGRSSASKSAASKATAGSTTASSTTASKATAGKSAASKPAAPKASASKAEPTKAASTKAEPTKAEPTKAASTKAEPTKAAASKSSAASAETESAKES